MHYASSTFVNKFKRSHSASGKPKLLIEWNMNRFGVVDTLTNNGQLPSEDERNDIFPLDSIISANRPRKASATKGFVQPGRLGQEAYARENTSIPAVKKTYATNIDAKYKYWATPHLSSDIKRADNSYYMPNCMPTVTYKYGLLTNKLIAQFENAWANPMGVQLEITTNGTTWTTAGPVITPSPGGTGRIELFLQDNGTWSEVNNYNNSISLKGLRVRVGGMNKPKVHCHVSEIALMREIDVTDRTVDYSFNYSMSEASFVAPLGKAESSTGSVTLSNIDGYFDNDRPSGEFFARVDSPARVTAWLTTTVDGSTAVTRQGTMFVSNWGEQSEDKRSLSLEDGSTFLKSLNPPPILLENVTGTEAIWRLLDSVGFSSYEVKEDPEGDLKIRYFWSDPERTVWEHIQEISEGLQIACFFDEFGVMQIRSRERTYSKDPDSSVWTFDGQLVSSAVAGTYGRASDLGKLPDIIDVSKPQELIANKVAVEYRTTTIGTLNKGLPKMEQVWEPQKTVALRSAKLRYSMTTTSTYGVFIDSNFNYWPFEGWVQVEGEIMKWTKKRYRYIDENGAIKYVWLKSNEEKDIYDRKNSFKSYQNKFDGGLYFGLDGRGAMSTYKRPHTPNSNKFNLIRTRHGTGKFYDKSWYTNLDFRKGVFHIRTSAKFGPTSFTICRQGYPTNPHPHYVGTSLRFPNNKKYSVGVGGIYFGGESADFGYYLELRPTSSIKNRKVRNEVVLYVRSGGKKFIPLNKGVAYAISKGKWYDIDISQKKVGTGFAISVMINGVVVMNPTIPASKALSQTMGGSYGVFARAHSHVDFNYLYAGSTAEEVPMGGDDSTRFDLIEGGYRSNFYNRYLYKDNFANRRMVSHSLSRLSKNAGFNFDDFGVQAHELREIKVQFDPYPVIHSRLYSSNESYVDCLEYVADHRSAKFIIAGKGRDNVIASGEDTLMYGSENPVQQKLFIYGRTVKQADAAKYEVENKKSINRRGEVELTISSPWIQSEPAAKKIGDWVDDHWSDGSEVIEISSFGNPLLQIGDIVSFHYVRKSMFPNKHQYYVTGIAYNYSEGLTTSYTLQRKTYLTV